MSASMGRGVPPPRVLHLPALCTGVAAGWQMSRLSGNWSQAQLLPRNQTRWEREGLVPRSLPAVLGEHTVWCCPGNAGGAGDQLLLTASARAMGATCRDNTGSISPPSAPCNLLHPPNRVTAAEVSSQSSLFHLLCTQPAVAVTQESAVLLPLLWVWPAEAQGLEPIPVTAWRSHSQTRRAAPAPQAAGAAASRCTDTAHPRQKRPCCPTQPRWSKPVPAPWAALWGAEAAEAILVSAVTRAPPQRLHRSSAACSEPAAPRRQPAHESTPSPATAFPNCQTENTSSYLSAGRAGGGCAALPVQLAGSAWGPRPRPPELC